MRNIMNIMNILKNKNQKNNTLLYSNDYNVLQGPPIRNIINIKTIIQICKTINKHSTQQQYYTVSNVWGPNLHTHYKHYNHDTHVENKQDKYTHKQYNNVYNALEGPKTLSTL